MALTDKLSAIGAAIREKTGGTELMTLDAMPAAIRSISGGSGGGEGGIPDTIVMDGSNLDYWGAYNAQNWLANLGKPITIDCSSVTSGASSMFYYSGNVEDLSSLTFISSSKSTFAQMDKCFESCYKLKKLPKLYGYDPEETTNGGNLQQYFCNCYQLREIPDDFFRKHDANGNLLDGWIIREHSNITYCYYRMFENCYSLRNFPQLPPTFSAQRNIYHIFQNCYVLDEAINLPVNLYNLTSGYTTDAFSHCERLKRLTWATQEDGTPYTCNWQNVTIDLFNCVGYSPDFTHILDYNSGITAAKQVTDDANYATLKDDPDWWTMDVNYSRYNHDSAVETINSLPDTSATSNGTNIIKFAGASGALTDGGAINTLTEDEIAVATAKGWTVEIV